MAKVIKEVRQLNVKLTEEELVRYSKELAKQSQDIVALEDAKADSAKKYAAQIQTAKCIIKELSRKVESGEEPRDIECQWEYDFKENIKRLFRNDTGEIVLKERIKDEERQMSFLDKQ